MSIQFCLADDSICVAQIYHLQDFILVVDLHPRQICDYRALGQFLNFKLQCFSLQQIPNLFIINLIVAHHDLKMNRAVLSHVWLNALEEVVNRFRDYSKFWLPNRSEHRVGLAWACNTVGEYSWMPAFESYFDQVGQTTLINSLVWCSLVETGIKLISIQQLIPLNASAIQIDRVGISKR